MCQKNIQSSVDQYTGSIYISEHSVKIRKTKVQFSPIYYTSSEMLHLPHAYLNVLCPKKWVGI
jgi:hypothetical protein